MKKNLKPTGKRAYKNIVSGKPVHVGDYVGSVAVTVDPNGNHGVYIRIGFLSSFASMKVADEIARKGLVFDNGGENYND